MAAKPGKRKAADNGEQVADRKAPLSAFAAAKARQSAASIVLSNQTPIFSDAPAPQDEVLQTSIEEENLTRKSSVRRADDPVLLPAVISQQFDLASDYEEEPDYIPGPRQPTFLSRESPAILEPKVISSWRPSSKSVIIDTERELVVRLQADETVALVGIFQLQIQQGIIEFCGAELRQSDSRLHLVYAPSSHTIPALKCLTPEAQVRVKNYCVNITALDRISPLFSRIWSNMRSDNTASSASYIRVAEPRDDPLGRLLQPLMVPPDWHKAIQLIASHKDVPQVLITGSRNSGKSTLAKLLSNRLLSRLYAAKGKNAHPRHIFFLDLDSTHPEYSPPGQISLVKMSAYNFGPSFTHLSSGSRFDSGRIIRSHAIRKNGAQEHAIHYLNCVADLVCSWKRIDEHDPAPLIIDTPPLAHVAGLDILLDLLNKVPHTHHIFLNPVDLNAQAIVEQLESASSQKGASFQLLGCGSNTSNGGKMRSESALQDMQFISYFHKDVDDNRPPIWNPQPLSFMTPITVSYSDSEPGFIGFQLLGNWIEPDFINVAINGNLISIIETEDEEVIEQYGVLPRTKELGLPYFPPSERGIVETLNPKSSRLVLVALLRSIEKSTKEFDLLIPRSHEHVLEGLNPRKLVFAYGCCETPGWAYLEDPHFDEYEVPRITSNQNEKEVGDLINEQTTNGFVTDTLTPYVARAEELERWGRLNMVRKVRKFQR